MTNAEVTTTQEEEYSYSHYEVLGLSSRSADPSLSAKDVKVAYKRALLRHHPDKLKSAARPAAAAAAAAAAAVAAVPTQTQRYTIDEISLAYRVLSSPTARAQYDNGMFFSRLRLRPLTNSNLPRGGDGRKADVQPFRSGLETVDLDDLDFDEQHRSWHRPCRCGDVRGFTITETELEEEAEWGVIITGCRGCSLWLEVMFEMVDDEEEAAG
ncbi:MAG: Diphthamide biosynthesis protein 4 [Sclerophora amabilis]|nr:MAG: Diphthamide biosynthesis protein 4 [Sclerophora amabilis]